MGHIIKMSKFEQVWQEPNCEGCRACLSKVVPPVEWGAKAGSDCWRCYGSGSDKRIVSGCTVAWSCRVKVQSVWPRWPPSVTKRTKNDCEAVAHRADNVIFFKSWLGSKWEIIWQQTCIAKRNLVFRCLEESVSFYDGHKEQRTLMGFFSCGWCYPSLLLTTFIAWIAVPSPCQAAQWPGASDWSQRVHPRTCVTYKCPSKSQPFNMETYLLGTWHNVQGTNRWSCVGGLWTANLSSLQQVNLQHPAGQMSC